MPTTPRHYDAIIIGAGFGGIRALHECRKIGLLAVRVVHGKGTGALRERVHGLLAKMPEVASWTWPASQPSGGWGATWVYLKPLTL